mgnify:CR=1 FL=1
MRGKLVDEVTAARIRRAAREGRVELAPRNRIFAHQQEVDQILRDIGFPEALVTDESCLSDFPLEEADTRRLSRQYGFEVGRCDRIAFIAERLAALRALLGIAHPAVAGGDGPAPAGTQPGPTVK